MTNHPGKFYKKLRFGLVKMIFLIFKKLKMTLEQKINEWLVDTSKKLNIHNLDLKEWPKLLKGKEGLVEKLDCSLNGLKSLPNFPNITWLHSSDNQLKSLPNYFNLAKLYCNGNQLEALPKFPNITDLDCSDNQLKSLPDFPNLNILRCEYNQLKSLPDYPNLTELYCDCNQLESLPNLPNLTHLCCSFNHIYSLPKFSNLTFLDCFDNQLKILPNLPNLTILSCWNNQLKSLPNYPQLTELYCEHNQLFSDDLNDWCKLWKLQKLRRLDLRQRGLVKVVKIMTLRLYLPRLIDLHRDLIYSPHHPGKFYKKLRLGDWSYENKSKLLNH